jgi:hypothetical protein
MFLLLLCCILILFPNETYSSIQFSPVNSWTLKAAIQDNSNTYYVWKPTCSSSLRIGDFVTTINYQAGGGTPPTNTLYCVQDMSGQVVPATTFTVTGTFMNSATNTSWDVVEGITSPSELTAGQFVAAASSIPTTPTPAPAPTGLLPSLLTALSLAAVTHEDTLKRAVATDQTILQSSSSSDYS